MGKLDQEFDETEDKIVESSTGHFRYMKKFKDGVSDGRKQARFHIKDKDLRATDPTVRRD
ncbi:MAG: hypothetical protein V3V14_08255 [Saprospiraceae bacterium]